MDEEKGFIKIKTAGKQGGVAEFDSDVKGFRHIVNTIILKYDTRSSELLLGFLSELDNFPRDKVSSMISEMKRLKRHPLLLDPASRLHLLSESRRHITENSYYGSVLDAFFPPQLINTFDTILSASKNDSVLSLCPNQNTGDPGMGKDVKARHLVTLLRNKYMHFNDDKTPDERIGAAKIDKAIRRVFPQLFPSLFVFENQWRTHDLHDVTPHWVQSDASKAT